MLIACSPQLFNQDTVHFQALLLGDLDDLAALALPPQPRAFLIGKTIGRYVLGVQIYGPMNRFGP